MSDVRENSMPADFGGMIGYWLNEHAYIARYGNGKAIEGVQFTPLNLLQTRKLLDDLIVQGKVAGHITDEHLRQADQLPIAHGLENTMPRTEVDEIAGPG